MLYMVSLPVFLYRNLFWCFYLQWGPVRFLFDIKFMAVENGAAQKLGIE